MCTVSMVSDFYRDKWVPIQPNTQPIVPTISQFIQPITREEFDALRKDVLEMKELLKRAVKYDKENDQPDCQNDEKIALLRQIAEMVGVDIDEVFAT